jgi:predicted DNA-binding transcriptional regulator YafY
MSRDNTAREQLQRLLYVIPAAARKSGVRITELADALGVDARLVLRDIREATARSFHQPAGAVETFTIFTDGRRVYVNAPHDFHRPVRLNNREALALGLGLRALAADADAPRRAEILDLAARLEADLSAPEVETVHDRRERLAEGRPSAEPAMYDASLEADEDDAWVHEALLSPSAAVPPPSAAPAEEEPEYEDAMMLAFDDDGFRGVVADAIELQRVCRLLYLKPGDEAPQQRRVAPYRLLFANGVWYVAAHDLERDDLRIFRMDRVLEATLTDVPATLPAAGIDSLLADNGAYIAADDVEVSVRYSPRIARWIVERDDALSLDGDGSVLVRHRVADPRWLVRHVLQYGGEAVIEEPAEARQWVASAAAALA